MTRIANHWVANQGVLKSSRGLGCGLKITTGSSNHLRFFAALRLGSVVNFAVFVRNGRKSGICLQNICSSRSIFTNVASRSEEHTSELQSLTNLVCRLLLEKKNK